MDSAYPKELATQILSDSDHSTKVAPTILTNLSIFNMIFKKIHCKGGGVFIPNADVHRRGGENRWTCADMGEGGSKISKKLRTSFVNGPNSRFGKVLATTFYRVHSTQVNSNVSLPKRRALSKLR